MVIRSRRGVANEAQLAQQIFLGYQGVYRRGYEPQVARVRSVVTDQFGSGRELLEGLSQELCGISGYEERMMAQVREYLGTSAASCGGWIATATGRAGCFCRLIWSRIGWLGWSWSG